MVIFSPLILVPTSEAYISSMKADVVTKCSLDFIFFKASTQFICLKLKIVMLTQEINYCKLKLKVTNN